MPNPKKPTQRQTRLIKSLVSENSGELLTKKKSALPVATEPGFIAITKLINDARQNAYQAINTALIDLYWQVGEYISRKIQSAEWGDGVVEQLANHRRTRSLVYAVSPALTYFA